MENKIIEAIDPEKDADGFHPVNIGRMVIGLPGYLPATPYGIIELLHRYKIETSGKDCVIIGRSNIVGRPLSISPVAERNGCHSYSGSQQDKNITTHLKKADIIVAAMGSPGFFKADMVKPGSSCD